MGAARRFCLFEYMYAILTIPSSIIAHVCVVYVNVYMYAYVVHLPLQSKDN